MREYIGLENDNGLQNYKTSHLPIINVKINNAQFKALIDTGSEISLINKNLFDKYLKNMEEKCVKISKINLISASGKKFAECNRVLNTEFLVENKVLIGDFIIVSDMNFDIILGEDILSQLKAIIDLGERFLEFEGNKVPIYKLNDLKNINNGDRAEVNILYDKRVNDNKDKYAINNIAVPNELEINCSPKYKRLIHELLNDYISLINHEPRVADGYIHKLKVDETKSFKCKTYPIPYKYRQQVIQNMINFNIISKTNYINIKKKDDNQIVWTQEI